MSTDPNHAANRWGDEANDNRDVEPEGNAFGFMWILAIVLMLLLVGGGFVFFRMTLMRERAAAEAARAEAVYQSELARQAADKAAMALANNVPNADPKSEQKKSIWPGMWLVDRDGKPMIHIFSDGSRESGVPGLIGYLKHDNPGIRESAADWLGAIGPAAKDAISELKKALDDADFTVRDAAKKAIQRIESDVDSAD